MAVTREQLLEWLKAAGGSDVKMRQDAERRLAILPRAVVREYIPALWVDLEKDFYRRRKNSYSVAFSVFGLILLYILLKLLLGKTGWINFPFHMIGFIVGPLTSSMKQRKPEIHGMVYVLTQHQYLELTPYLIEALPIAEMANTSGVLHRVEQVMAALTLLLPRYAAMDLPDLNEKQRRILRGQLRRYSKKLRNPSAVLTDVESAFLATTLAFLHRERALRDDKKMALTVESLASERVDVDHERREHRQVREAARQAIVRLYG